MIKSHVVIEILAERIAAAYRRPRPRTGLDISTMGASMIAATMLLKAHLEDSSIPLDPELFVISQSKRSKRFDPWRDLARPLALRAYQRNVERIVRSLRKELNSEIALAEKKMQDGASLFQSLMNPDRRISGLARFILAHRHDRKALADRFLHEAVAQHRACPLYRQATSGLLSDHLYPDEVLLSKIQIRERIGKLQEEGVTRSHWN